jgi:peptidoglycan/LPS O-acetylase OafA/YrhL
MSSRGGGFDTLRLLAALLVFHSHSFAIAGLPEPSVKGFTLGGVAVAIFFAMSGYWVSRSALDRGLASFAAARALRIVPGLFVCCLTTIALCALATSEIVNDYFRNPTTWRWLLNAFPFLVPQPWSLPGVFEDGAIHHPNGALWSLPYEVFCYLVAAAAAAFGPKGLRLAMTLAAAAAAALALGAVETGPIPWLANLDQQTLTTFVAAFFLGAALNGAGSRTALAVTAAGAAVWFWSQDFEVVIVSGVAMFGGLAVWVGRALPLDRVVTRGRDVSYGVYIYAFPLQQLTVRALPPHDPASYALYYGVSLAATLALAWISWTLVEKPALRLKPQLIGLIDRGVARLPIGALRPRPAN